jgi:Zn-dependent M28 family amino/carboxypeptidase
MGRARQLLQEENEFLSRMRGLGSPLVLAFERRSERVRGGRSPRVFDPEQGGPGRNTPSLGLGGAQTSPVVFVYGAAAARFYDSLPAGATQAAADVRIPAPAEAPVKVRNVAGILRGSDPALKETYVIVSAHYDHLGVRDNCDPSKDDCINNGANDDGSGTVGVVELAAALSKLNPRPRRSILFLTFFGEELGGLGSRYYARHPLVPLAQTVAQLNMEQIGRTDDSEGPQVGTLAVTGFDYSDVGAVVARAGEAEGVRVYRHPTKSDAYFSRSDNQSLADAGVPAHTAGVAFDFPDYHNVGDEWQKVDFANMERIVRTVGRALLSLADSTQEPHWNEQNPKAAPYIKAWKTLHGK